MSWFDAGSANGRQHGSEPWNLGSIPSPAAKKMTINYEDFEKVDIRLGKIIEVLDFPEARNPSFKLKIDFGPEIGVKTSSVQAVGAHSKDELSGMLVLCVVNFLPKKVGKFTSEVLTLGFPNTEGIGWVLATPSKTSVKIGDRLK